MSSDPSDIRHILRSVRPGRQGRHERSSLTDCRDSVAIGVVVLAPDSMSAWYISKRRLWQVQKNIELA